MKNKKTKKKEMLDLIMKDSILTAAADTLQKYGAGGFTMEKAAADANIAKGTIYLYFKNKSELLKQLIEKIKKPMCKYMIEIKESGAPVKEKFEKIFFHLLSGIEGNLAFVRVLLRAAELDEELKKLLRKDDLITIGIFEEILKEGVRNKEISLSNPAYAAKIIFASLMYMMRERGEGYSKFMPVKKEVDSFIGLLKYGFENRKSKEDKKIEKKKSNCKKN